MHQRYIIIIRQNNLWHTSKCVRFRIIQYKILNGAYITAVGLSRMDDKHPDLCWHNWGEKRSTTSPALGLSRCERPLVSLRGLSHSMPVGTQTRQSALDTGLFIHQKSNSSKLERDSWLDSLNMERAACWLKDFDEGPDDHRDAVSKFLV